MKLGLLTLKQKELIEGSEFATDSYFNPIEDKNGKWIISVEEIENCTNEKFAWVKGLPLIDFEPKIVNI